MKKIYLIISALVCAMTVWADATPSGELFATYQKQGETFYKGSGEADLNAESFDWNVNYYIVTCGDSVLLRATTTEDRNFDAGWQTQLRIWTGAYANSNEIQTNAGGGTKNCYTSVCRKINPAAEDVKIHFFLNWEGNCVTQTFDFNRASINNPIVDEVAPSIDPEDVTMEEVDGVLVFTFGDVDADDEYFYYVADTDHSLGGISLTNKVYITKPTVEDGITYTFKCYAVDYNGNKSAYKEHSITMPFNSSVNVALNKPCSAGGAENDAHRAAVANDGNMETYWGTWSVGDFANANYWTVDLGTIYVLSKISIYSSGYAGGGAHIVTLQGKQKESDSWTTIFNDLSVPESSDIENVAVVANARYLKFSATEDWMISIKEFEVYASSVYTPSWPTAIVNTEDGDKAIKVIENGQLVIIKNGVKYNALGAEIK